MMSDKILKKWAYTAPLKDVVDRSEKILAYLTDITKMVNVMTKRMSFYARNSHDTQKVEVMKEIIADAGEVYSQYFDEYLIYKNAINHRSGKEDVKDD